VLGERGCEQLPEWIGRQAHHVAVQSALDGTACHFAPAAWI